MTAATLLSVQTQSLQASQVGSTLVLPPVVPTGEGGIARVPSFPQQETWVSTASGKKAPSSFQEGKEKLHCPGHAT